MQQQSIPLRQAAAADIGATSERLRLEAERDARLAADERAKAAAHSVS